MGCSEGCKEEFKCSNFLLGYDRPHLLISSQWSQCGGCDVFYLVYRLVMGAVLIIMLIITGITYRPGGVNGEEFKFFIYLTNLTFLNLNIDVVIQAVLAIYGFHKYRNNNKSWEKAIPEMTWYLKMSWVITNMTTAMTTLVTFVYWALLYNGGVVTYDNFFVHGFNSIYVVINVFITGMPVRIYHVFHAMIFAGCYVVFTIIYQLAGHGEAIYGILDWSNPTKAALVGVGFAAIGGIIVWLIYYALYRIRLAIFGCLVDRTNNVGDSYMMKWAGGSLQQGFSNPAFKLDYYVPTHSNPTYALGYHTPAQGNPVYPSGYYTPAYNYPTYEY